MLRHALLASVALLLLLSPALADTKKVVLKDGRELIGEVTKTPGGWEVKTKLGVVPVPGDQVVSMTEIVTPEQEYKNRLAKINPDSAEDHFALAQWTYQNNLLEAARRELQAALKIKPNHEKAQLLLRQVEARGTAGPGAGTTTSPTGPGIETVRNANLLKMLVGDEDIQSIRMAELKYRGSDDTVQILLKNNIEERFIKGMAGRDEFRDPLYADKFRKLDVMQKVRYMLRHSGEDDVLRKDIVIKTDPKVLAEFRTRIWPIIAQNCATTACHGSAIGKGRLKLFNIIEERERRDYTNFVILDGYVNSDSRMFDRDHSDQSLILQHGLPQAAASSKHKVVITPVPFENQNNQNYVKINEWIKKLVHPHPDYQLKYEPPLNIKIDSGLPNLTLPESETPAGAGASSPK